MTKIKALSQDTAGCTSIPGCTCQSLGWGTSHQSADKSITYLALQHAGIFGRFFRPIRKGLLVSTSGSPGPRFELLCFSSLDQDIESGLLSESKGSVPFPIYNPSGSLRCGSLHTNNVRALLKPHSTCVLVFLSVFYLKVDSSLIVLTLFFVVCISTILL